MEKSKYKIARFARSARWGVTILLLLTIVSQFLEWGPLPDYVRVHGIASAGSGTSAIITSLLHMLFIILALFQLTLMLKHLENGELFSSGVTSNLRGFARFMLLAVLTSVLIGPILQYIFNSCLSGPSCMHQIPVDLRGLWMLLINILFFLVARLLDEARRVEDENRQII